jgi:hypothetical protein
VQRWHPALKAWVHAADVADGTSHARVLTDGRFALKSVQGTVKTERSSA